MESVLLIKKLRLLRECLRHSQPTHNATDTTNDCMGWIATTTAEKDILEIEWTKEE